MVELSNIPFSQMFTCLSYERQNVAEKMEIIAGELPICVCVCAHLAMIQDQALVASKHLLIETEDTTVNPPFEVVGSFKIIQNK